LEREISAIEDHPDRLLLQKYNRLFQMFTIVNSEGLLLLKGHVAVSLHIDEPLAAIELLFSGFFSNLTTSETCLAVSSFVESAPKIQKNMIPSIGELWARLKQQIRPLEAAVAELGMPKLAVPRKRLMPFMYKFLDTKDVHRAVAGIDGLSEGLAVRILKRVRELLVKFEAAAAIMGVEALKGSFHEALTDFVNGCNFDNSLYTTE
jgi:superfamily II RNA helicase